jgi:hypothetical protein
MANGSFGLSGLPTAPTTIASSSSGENNALSAATVPVFSTSGFNSGDLIYLKQGDYGNPSGVGQTGGLVLQDSVAPVFSGTTGSYLRWPNVQGGNRGGNSCAKLTNGNTVFVYYDMTSTFPNYVILDSSGVEVVSPTLISSTFFSTSNAVMGVVALVGGGFAVAWIDTSTANRRIAYAIYTNTGSVTLAANRDTTITVTSTNLIRIAMVARADGGFAVAVRNSGNATQVRFFSATAALGSWTTPTGYSANAQSDLTMTLLARANSTVALVITDTTSAVLFNISTANVTTGSGRLGTTLLTNMTAVLLADNSIAVFGSETTFGLNYYNVTGTTTATWGSALIVNLTSYQNSVPVAYLTSAGNVLIFSLGSNNPQFQFCSTAGASLTGGPYPLTAAAQPFNNIVYPGFIESGSTVAVYWTPVVSESNTVNPIMTSMNVDSSTYALQRFNSTDGGTLATSTVQALAGYNRSNSNPNGASYFSSGSGDAPATSTTGTTLVAQTVIESVDCDAMSTASLPDGGCVIAYKYLASPNQIKYAVLSKAGVLQTIVNVAIGITQDFTIRVAVLSDGKICVIYYNSNTAGSGIISFAIYSTSYVLLNSGVLPGLSSIESPSTNGARIADLAALPDGYFVVAYAADTSGLNFKTFTNTGAAYSANYSVSGATAVTDQNLAVAGCLDGSVMVFWKNSGTTYAFQLYRKTAGSAVYTGAGSGGISGTSVQQVERQVALCPDGGFFYNIINTTIRLNKTNMSLTAIGIAVDTSGSPTPSVASLGLAVTGSGLMLMYNPQVGILYYYNSSSPITGSYTLSLANNGASSHTNIAGSYGNNAFIALVNASNFPTYTLVSMGPVTYPFLYTTSNFSVPLTASPATGYYLVGVATTDCAPGGTGTVQINGSALLSSSYPSGTTFQAFDFSNPILFGVRGTVVGRNISMQGNVL